MKKIVVLTGAGISAESGFSTFRDADGLWNRYPVEKVATPEGWQENPALVTDFYNGLRRQLVKAAPNEAHQLLAQLEERYRVTVVTQNVDNLHERGGSSHVIHLHGELMRMCSSNDPDDADCHVTLSPEHPEVEHGTLAADGSLLRPWIVWFGEAVPRLEEAIEEVLSADIFVVIGTSLNVYPAASLVQFVMPGVPIYLIDPKEVNVPTAMPVTVIKATASEGLKRLLQML